MFQYGRRRGEEKKLWKTDLKLLNKFKTNYMVVIAVNATSILMLKF